MGTNVGKNLIQITQIQRIIVLYIVVACIWILFSDQFLQWFFSDIVLNSRLQTYKGWFFVMASGVYFYSYLEPKIKEIDILHGLIIESKEDAKKKNEFIETILDNLPIGLAVNYIDEGSASYMNKEFENIYGWPSEIITDIDSFFKHVYPDPVYRKQVQEGIMEDIGSGDIGRMQWDDLEIISKNGEKRIISAKNIPIYKQNLMISTVQDITRRKQAEDELKMSEKLFKSLFEQAAVGIAQVSPGGQFLKINSRFCEIIGYSENELLNLDFKTITHHDDIYLAEQCIKDVFSGITDKFEIEKRYIHKNGSIVWVKLYSRVVRDEFDSVKYAIAVIVDLTKRKQAELKIRQYNERFNMLHEIDKSIISSFSTEQIADNVLKRLRKLVSCPFARLMLLDSENNDMLVFAVESSYDSQIKKGTHLKLSQNLNIEKLERGESLLISDLREVKEPSSPLAKLLIKEGMRSALSVPLIVENKLIGVLNLASSEINFFSKECHEIVYEVATQLAIAVHQSELNTQIQQNSIELEERVKERTSQLENTNKELESFAYSVSHDLRAPLRAIDAYSQIVVEDYANKLDDEGIRLLNVVRENSQKMDQLIKDILSMSKVTRIELRYSTIDMESMVYSVYEEIATHDQKDTFDLSISSLPQCYGDSVLIKKVWSNLLSNALKYTMPKDERIIEVGNYSENGKNVYYVKDNGVGFNAKYAEKLFGIFQRLHRTDEFEGTGVGLAIVQQIIHRHGGEVWAEGKINKGSKFYFSMPER